MDAVAERRPRSVGATGPQQGAALRPRAVARSRDHRDRTRRSRGHGQDRDGDRRGSRTGRRAATLRTTRRVSPTRSRRSCRRRLPARRPGRKTRPVDVGDPRRNRGAHRPALEQRCTQPDRRPHRARPAHARVRHLPTRSVAAAAVRRRR